MRLLKQVVFLYAAALIGCAAILHLSVAPLRGDSIPGLFNTGMGDNGSVINLSAVDSHYTLITAPDASGYGPNVFATDFSGFDGLWMANSTTSKWIGPEMVWPSPDTWVMVSPAGTYVYRTTFNLAGYDPVTAAIVGLSWFSVKWKRRLVG